MKIPDLVGINFKEASEIFEGLTESYNISVKETRSPFSNKEYKKNECRVVRQKVFDNTIIITVSYF